MEIEAKFSIPDGSTFDRLLTAHTLAGFGVGAFRRKQIHDRYLDTADRAFLQGGFACRVRVVEGRHLVTLKSIDPAEGALHSRQELEVWIEPGMDASPEQWPASEASELARRLNRGQRLETLFEAWQERHVAALTRPADGQGVAELSLDHVRLVEATQAAFLELEAELLSAGREQDLCAVIDALTNEWHLAAESRSKFERGLAVARPDLVESLEGWRRQWMIQSQNGA